MRILLTLIIFLSAFTIYGQQSFEILKTQEYKYGAYNSFKEFRDNNPSVTSGFTIKADSGKETRYELYNEKGKKMKTPYGFSDGKNLYINSVLYSGIKSFVKITSLGNIIYFEDKAGKANSMANQASVGVLFGAVGGAIAGANAASKSKANPGWIIYINDENGQPYALSFDTLESIFEEANQDLLKQLKAEKDKKDFTVLNEYVMLFNSKAIN